MLLLLSLAMKQVETCHLIYLIKKIQFFIVTGKVCVFASLSEVRIQFLQTKLLLSLLSRPQYQINLTRSPSADDLGGPSSIAAVLDGYNSLISNTLSRVAQVKTEISALTGYLNHWGQTHCKEQRPKLQVPEPLQELQSRKELVLTVGIEALMRVKEFLELLLKNLEHLETC